MFDLSIIRIYDRQINKLSNNWCKPGKWVHNSISAKPGVTGKETLNTQAGSRSENASRIKDLGTGCQIEY